jgi:hypothetical protein
MTVKGFHASACVKPMALKAGDRPRPQNVPVMILTASSWPMAHISRPYPPVFERRGREHPIG